MRISVTLKDLTAGKILNLKGIAKLVGDFGSMCVDSLEGYSPVFINVTGHNKQAKIRKHSNGNYVKYCLEDK